MQALGARRIFYPSFSCSRTSLFSSRAVRTRDSSFPRRGLGCLGWSRSMVVGERGEECGNALKCAVAPKGAKGHSGTGGTPSPRTRSMSGGSAYEDDVQVAIRAVSLASRLCQAVQRNLLSKETQAKADQSPVTVADYGSQALVSWVLQQESTVDRATLSFSMVAEEDSEDLRREEGSAMLERVTQLVNETIAADGSFGSVTLSKDDVLTAIDRGNSPGGPNGRHWVLDPIDGTRGFVRGDQYAVALGLLDNGVVVVGVLGCPNLPLASIGPNGPAASDKGVGCLFAASKGAGTIMHAMDGSLQAKRVHVSDVLESKWAAFCESYEAAHSKQDLTANIARILGVSAPPIRIDSQAKYGAMARGDAVIYLRFPHAGYREKIWDHAAGSIVITEAGGEVFDAAGKPLDFAKGRFLDLDHGIIATNSSLKDAVLAAVQTAVKEEQLAQSGQSPSHL